MNFNFQGKYIIKANIELLTGLHIGGSSEGIEIGGLDNPVIKNPRGVPFIPGSSLKGKMRSLVEWAIPDEENENKTWVSYKIAELQTKGKEIEVGPSTKGNVARVFGCSAGDADAEIGPTRLTVRDAFPTHDTIKEWEKVMGENIYTELKTENAIDRVTSTANPRPLERVPAESIFSVEMVYDVYETDDFNRFRYLFYGMALLEDSYLGGGGTRGNGQIKFNDITVTYRPQTYYIERDGEFTEQVNLQDAIENFDTYMTGLQLKPATDQ